MNIQRFLCLLLIVLPGVLTTPASAERLEKAEHFSSEYYQKETLTGDWNGLRNRMHDSGFDLEVETFVDLFANPVGGRRQRAHIISYLETELMVDFDRWVGWRNARAMFLGYALFNTDPSVDLDTRQTVSSLEATDTAKLFEAWLEQTWLDRRLSFKAGLYSLDTEFDFKQTANLFINGVFGTGLDLSEFGRFGPAIYPFSALGARLKWESRGFYAMTAMMDGVPGDPNNPHGTQVRLQERDGLLVANEIGYRVNTSPDSLLHLGVGVWVYTTRIPDLARLDGAGNPVTHRGRNSVYGFVDARLFSEAIDPQQGLDGFFRIGVADSGVSRFETTLTTGVSYTGLLRGREKDVLGLGLSVGWAGDSFQEAQELAGLPVDAVEIVLEATYAIPLYPWFQLQPDIQWFFNPGLNPAVDDAIFLGMRFVITL